jgi:hypothetical protein
MALWVQRLEPFIEEHLFSGEPGCELKLYASMLAGIFYGAPRHRMLRRCVTRVAEMLDEKLDVNNKLKAATFLMSYCNLAGQFDLASQVHARAAPLLDSPDVTPLNELWWYLRVGHYFTMLGDLRAARGALEHVREVAHNHGLSGLRSAALLIRSYQLVVACMQGDLEEAQRLHSETEALVVHSRPMDNWHVVQGRAYLAILRKDAAGTSKWGHAAYLAAKAESMIYTEVLGLLHQAHGIAAAGRSPELDATLANARSMIADTFLTYFESEVRYLIAYAALVDAAPEALRAVEDAVRHAREHDYHHPNMLRFSVALPAVLGAALEAGIEPAYCIEVIGRYQLKPAREDIGNWPWPIRIHALGRFEVQLDGKPLRFSGKTPRKPLALLKAIVANGGTEVPQAKLIDTLWPNEEGDAGKQSFGVTMVRLRKLLGVHEAVVVADERVSLNPALCWVDARAFEARLKQADNARAGADGARVIARTEQALALYQGPFLPADADEAWSVRCDCEACSPRPSKTLADATKHEASGSAPSLATGGASKPTTSLRSSIWARCAATWPCNGRRKV